MPRRILGDVVFKVRDVAGAGLEGCCFLGKRLPRDWWKERSESQGRSGPAFFRRGWKPRAWKARQVSGSLAPGWAKVSRAVEGEGSCARSAAQWKNLCYGQRGMEAWLLITWDECSPPKNTVWLGGRIAL